MLGTQQEKKEERRWRNETILRVGKKKYSLFPVVT